MKKRPLSKGFGRVVHMDSDTLNKIKGILADGSLSKEEKLEKIKNILKDLEYDGKKEFGRGKGIFRASDIKGDSVEEVMKELRIEASADGRVIVELKTEGDVEVFTDLWDSKIDPVHSNYHWPYTGTGFISSRNGEILPEYYLSKGFKEMKDLHIEGIEIITKDGKYSLGW